MPKYTKPKSKHRPTKRSKKTAWTLDDADWQRIQHIFPVKIIGTKGGRP